MCEHDSPKDGPMHATCKRPFAAGTGVVDRGQRTEQQVRVGIICLREGSKVCRWRLPHVGRFSLTSLTLLVLVLVNLIQKHPIQIEVFSNLVRVHHFEICRVVGAVQVHIKSRRQGKHHY